MVTLAEVKNDLRVDSDDFDNEIEMLIAGAQAYLDSSGVTDSASSTDPRVAVLIRLFCKKMFGYDEKDNVMEFAFKPDFAFTLILNQVSIDDDNPVVI